MKSYFIFLSRHKLYTSIQAIGLIISIAFIILIGNYVWQQYRIAHSNKFSDRIFAVGSDEFATLSPDDKGELEGKLSFMEGITRLSNENIVLSINDEKISFPLLEVDKDFFELFPEFELIEGNFEDLTPGTSILISENFAGTHFPEENPIGRNVGSDWVIKAIYRINTPTVLQETDVIRIIYPDTDSEHTPFSTVGSYMTFIKMPPKTDIDKLESEITKILRPHYDENWIKEFKVYDLPSLYFTNDKSWHLKNGNKEMINLLIGVVILLLISSMINYINLSLALSGRRAKEMATHMLLGASKKIMLVKSIFESIIFIFICSLIGLGLAYVFKRPLDDLLFNALTDQLNNEWRFSHLSIKWNTASIFIFIGFIVLLGFLSGVMPAFYSSRYKPIDTVNGIIRAKNRQVFGKIFIVFQNVIAVILISLAIVMESQLNHIRNMPLNSNTDNIYLIQTFFETYDEAIPLIDRYKKIPEIKKIGFGTSYPGHIGMYSSIKIKDEEKIQAGMMRGDRNYFDIMGLKILSGNKNPEGSGILYISETAANLMGITDNESASRYLGIINFNGTSIDNFGGIFKNVPNTSANTSEFNYTTFFILANPDKMRWSNTLLLEVIEESPELEHKIMAQYEEYIKELRGTYVKPWEKGFLSDLNEVSLVTVKSTVVLLEIFMVISIILALLGLIAMSTYYANENTKGIAIRKVLGSDVNGEIWRNIRLYMILVLIAIAMAIPLSIVISREYLSRFAYRIDNYWWIFIVSSLGSLLIASLSVYWQISRSAHINPATELKKE